MVDIKKMCIRDSTKACEGLYQQFVNAESRLSFNNPAMLTAIYGCNIALSWFGAKYILHGALTTGQLNALFGYIMNILMALMMLSKEPSRNHRMR